MRWRGEKRIHTFCPLPPHQHTHPLISIQPSYPIISILARRIKGTTPPPSSGKTSPSQLRLTKSDGCLIVCDTDRGLSLLNLKQIASPWGGDYWTSREDKAGTVKPFRVWRWREIKLEDSMWAHVFLCFSFVYGRAARRLSLCLCVSNARTCEWQSATRARGQANAHNKINGFLAHLSLLSPPPIYHKFTPVLSVTSSIFYLTSTSPSVPLLTRRTLSPP